MHVDREGHFHRIGLFIGQRLHAHHRGAFIDGQDAPIDALFRIGVDGHGLRRGPGGGVGLDELANGRKAAAIDFQRDLGVLGCFEIIVHIGREDHFILLHKEARGLRSRVRDSSSFDYIRLALADARASLPMVPDLHLAGRLRFSGIGRVSVGGRRP